MVPTTVIEAAAASLLANDTATLDAVLDVEVVLVIAAFTPAPTLVIGDLTLATFDGYAPKARQAGVNLEYTDPATGDQMIEISPPAGGWNWETTGVTDLPQTVHGFALTNSTGATLYGVELLDEPVVLTASGQGITIPPVTYRLRSGSIS